MEINEVSSPSILRVESFAAVVFPRWNFFYRFLALKHLNSKFQKANIAVHVRMLYINLIY